MTDLMHFHILIILTIFSFVFARRRLKSDRTLQELVIKNDTSNTTSPYYNSWNMTDRVAICLTGQLRSANHSWTSGTLIQSQGFKMFGPADPPTVAETIINALFRTLARERGVDVFMYLTAHPEANNSAWDGRPETYEPMVGDTRACEIFSNNDVFQGTGNRFFCLIEPEEELMDPFIINMGFWKHLSSRPDQTLAQLYGIYRANLAAKEYAIMSGAHYKYKIRLRPDTAFVRPFPDFSAFTFSSGLPGTECVGTIFYANAWIYRNGNEDWFNVGLTEHMDKLLDRYIDLISTPFVHNAKKSVADLENHLVGLMRQRYKICMAWKDALWMVVIRVVGHQYNTWVPKPKSYGWVDMNKNRNEV